MNIRPVRLLTFCSIVLLALSAVKTAAALTLDPDFGHDGRVAVELGMYGSRANAVLALPDGRILAAGSSTSSADKDFMLFRLLPDGRLDQTFNYDGAVTTAVGRYDDEVLTLALQKDGKILAGGYSSNGDNRDFALVRYNSDGSVDHDFGVAGMTVTAVGGSNDEITDMVVQDDGSIVITGAAQGKNGRAVVLARYKADGSLDASFAQDGFSLSVTGVDAQAESVALSTTGRILIAGSYSDGRKRGLMLLGFDAAGKLDTTFGAQGIAVPADSSVFSEGYSILLDEDGKIFVAGAVGEQGARDAALFRFTAAGQPDSSFENNGVLVTSAGAGDDVLYDLALVGEKIAAAGFKTVDEQREFLLITYAADKNQGDENFNGSSVTMQTEAGPDKLTAEAVSTDFSDYDDKSTALTAVSNNSVVTVGESVTSAGSSAAVSKYLTVYALKKTGGTTAGYLDVGSQQVQTEEPVDVTRTTVILFGNVTGLSNVTDVGFVYSTMPNPTKEGSSEADNDNAPTVTNNSPSSVSGTSATISLTTDVDATCKYDAESGKAYDDMAETFSTTGETSHSQLLSNLEVKTYTYYARCKNVSSGEVNTADTVISFTVKSSSSGTEDTTPPTVSETTAAAFNIDDDVILKVSTSESATCRYSENDEDYDKMIKVMKSETNGQYHSSDLEPLEAENYTYYVRCQDTAGNKNSSSTTISFLVTPVVVTDTTVENFSSTDDVKLTVKTDVEATCKYNKDKDAPYDDMTESMVADILNTKDHSVDLGKLSAGNYTYYVRCKNTESGETSPVGTKITFTVTAAEAAHSQMLNFSDQIISNSLHSLGSFFISTAHAQTTTTTDNSSETSSDDADASKTAAAEDEFLEEGSVSAGSGSGSFSSKLENLKPGTFFYARAYAISNGNIYYGNQVGFRTADSCFVATAAFGSVFAPAVQTLRDFRDQFLSSNAAARAFVDLYYQVSPSLADLISQHRALRFVVRLLLLPVTGAAWLALQFGIWMLLLPTAAVLLVGGWQEARRRRLRSGAV